MPIAEVGGGTQRNTNSAAASPNCLLAFPGNVTAGNLIIVAGVVWFAAGAITSVTTMKSSGTATIGSVSTIFGSTGIVWSGGTGYGFISYSIVSGTGSLTMDISTDQPVGNYINIACDEFSGTDTTTPLDVNGGENTFGSATSVTDSITTLTSGDLIIGVVAQGGGVDSQVAGAGYTSFGSDTSSAISPYNAEFQIVGAAGAYNVDFSWPATPQAGTDVNAAFKVPATTTDSFHPGTVIFRPRLRVY